MENDDVVTFRQANLQCTSFAAFLDMKKRGQFCDLTIKVQNYSFLAHRVILAAGIPYFQSVFGVESEEKEVAVEDLEPGALETLIQFAYTSAVNITAANVKSLLVASEFLQLKEVRNACIEFLSKRLCIENVVKIRNFACSVGNSKLTESSDLYIRENFEEFWKCDDFLSLPDSCIKELISSDDLKISSEETVFEALIKWVEFSPTRFELLPQLLGEVRMIYLPISYLKEKVDTQELILSSKPCRDLVNEVKYYHLLPTKTTDVSKLNTRLRNHFRQDIYAVSSCETCGYSVHRFEMMGERWHNLISKKLKCGNLDHVFAVNGIIYLFFDQIIQTFCPTSYKWETLHPRHKSVQGSAAAVHENVIYYFGASEDCLRKTVRRFDTQRKEWLEEKSMKTSRRDSAAASLGNSIFVTGGYEGGPRLKTVEKYCPSTNEWTNVAPMLTARDDHACASLKGQIYVCGGVVSANNTLCTVEMYDPVIDMWTFVSSMSIARSKFTLLSHQNRLYALEESGAEIYDPENDQWQRDFSLPAGFKSAISIPTVHARHGSD